jgi:hypothetical protein
MADEKPAISQQLAQPILTAEERQAIEFFVGFHTEGYGLIERHAATLRKLAERTK